jgi:hypothetical protein
MQRFGPPPSYPTLRIPGLNAPIPEGCVYTLNQYIADPPVARSGVSILVAGANRLWTSITDHFTGMCLVFCRRPLICWYGLIISFSISRIDLPHSTPRLSIRRFGESFSPKKVCLCVFGVSRLLMIRQRRRRKRKRRKRRKKKRRKRPRLRLMGFRRHQD